MKVRHILESAGAVSALLLLLAAPAAAQYTMPTQSEPATGEKYNVEVAFGFWNPTPEIVFSSEQFGITGQRNQPLERPRCAAGDVSRFPRGAAPRHASTSSASSTSPSSTRSTPCWPGSIVFNGIVYSVGLPVQGEFKWDAWRFGYEYDFIYRDRGFVGVIAEAKYTHVSAETQ